jgi:hypothetical protein
MTIANLAKAYNNFQNDYGQSISPDYEEIINELFSVDFKKVANGQELVAKRDGFGQQLAGVKAFAGNWIINANIIIPSVDNKQCTIRYILSSEKAGKFDVIAILSSNNGKQIDTIDEIYYQIS